MKAGEHNVLVVMRYGEWDDDRHWNACPTIPSEEAHKYDRILVWLVMSSASFLLDCEKFCLATTR